MLDTFAVCTAPAAFGTVALLGASSALFGDADISGGWPAVVGQVVLGLGSVGTAMIAMLAARDRLRFDAGNAAREKELEHLKAECKENKAEIESLVRKTDACHDERDRLAAKVEYLERRVEARDTAHPLTDETGEHDPLPG